MDFPELAFKRIDKSWIKTDDYIEWANELLEGGSNAPSIWELAVCRRDAHVDPDQIERLFQSCVDELGLELPSDWYAALCSYSSSICKSMARGAIQPMDCMGEMLTLAEDLNAPYIHWIWIDLARDIEATTRRDSEVIKFNGTLDLQNSDDSIRRVGRQFVALCAIQLPEKFPLVWICQACNRSSDESTFTEMTTRTCTKCGAISAMRNMRFFEHRDALVMRSFVTASVESSE